MARLLPGRARRARRQETERIDVPLGLGRDANAEVHVRLGRHKVGARTDRSQYRALFDRRAAHDRRRAELERRHRVPVSGLNRDDAAAVRDGADEGDRTGRRCADARALAGGDVDAPMLTPRVRVRRKGKRSKHRTVRRPGPPVCGWGRDERREHSRGREQWSHGRHLRCIVRG